RVQPVLRLVPDDALHAVDYFGGDLLTPIRGQAVQHDGVTRGVLHSGGVDGERREHGAALLVLVPLCAHGYPRVGGHHVRAFECLLGVRGDGDRAPRLAGDSRRVCDNCRVGVIAGRAADPYVHACGGAAEQVRVGHVVGGVADVGEREPGEFALV